MTITSTSRAAVKASSVKNVAFTAGSQNVERIIVLVGTFDPLKTSVVPEVKVPVFSHQEVGDIFGLGSMVHRMAIQSFLGSGGVPTVIMPQAEAGGAVAATGTVTFVVGTLLAGTYHMYISGIAVPFNVLAGDTATAVATAAVDAINANADLPVTGASAIGVLTVTAKTKGTYGNDISIRFNIKSGNTFPVGHTSNVIVDMTGGAGIPDIADALNALGVNDNANEDYNTDIVNGYGEDSATLDIIETYVGSGNTDIGLYSKSVGRPFRMLRGNVVAGTAGLTALIVITDLRLQDRANGVISVPDSANHPVEIASQAMGHMARTNQQLPEQNYVDIQLIDIDPGATDQRWTSDYANRDLAVKSGISPTFVKSGVVCMQNVMTHYRPANVAPENNGYASMRNISILQNILATVLAAFNQAKWQQITLVEDTANVTNSASRAKARDITSVRDELVSVILIMAGKAWLYESAFSIAKLNEPGAVVVRTGTNGFDSVLSVILSGEGGIIDNVVEFDTSIAVLLG